MLPIKQFRALDAAMQSLRAAGLRFEWQWKDKDTGWVCAGFADDLLLCELVPTVDPLVGQLRLKPAQIKKALEHPDVPEKFKSILNFPIEKDRSESLYEFELESTPQRDLLSDFVEALQLAFLGPEALTSSED
jgi:hypothetical protein